MTRSRCAEIVWSIFTLFPESSAASELLASHKVLCEKAEQLFRGCAVCEKGPQLAGCSETFSCLLLFLEVLTATRAPVEIVRKSKSPIRSLLR